ncbi:helix-turn-helix domain-containing protein [Microbacterium hominis]|uniref:helix-turn-helix domain-containing protein n=1 Tax=Microbacterium hominis TaxID=162426 RepID=UPI00168B1E83|nr:helix-turn-helix transcriptional regulator [Microbacterium hominis]QOC26084.1 helix-turn-helix domain-containing protein [Microbacterium hominis]QOC30054.1 helix-turn-helix domain-containing protein [Microbacterium hominis]
MSLLTLQVPKVGSVLIPDSVINRATSAVLKGVMLESELQQKSWAEKSGISPVTLQKLLSGNQSVKVPQLLALAHASKFTPEEIMERIDRAIARAVSEAASNVTPIRPNQSPKDGAQEDFDGQARAANLDAELEQDEPDAP